MGFLVALPLLNRFVSPIGRIVAWMRLPVPSIITAVAGLLCYTAYLIAVWSIPEQDANQHFLRVSANEMKETVVAVLFLCAAVSIWARESGKRRIKRFPKV